MATTAARFTIVVPLTPVDRAKSRLTPASGSAAAHSELVQAIRSDTLGAVAGSRLAARVLIVAPAGTGLPVRTGLLVPESRPDGLNAAVRLAAERAARWWPDEGIAVLVGDLPALLAADLDAVLAAAGPARRFVPDRQGTGTTMLLGGPGLSLEPAFGAGSAVRHATVATRLEAPPRVRADVDTPDDLQAAADLGLGPATSSVLARR